LPPLGLITLAALTPPGYAFRLVDLNCRPLEQADLDWAELVCVSVMITQQEDFFRVAARCRAAGKPVIVGGPYPTAEPQRFQPHADVVVGGEGEAVWPQVLADLEAGRLRRHYSSDVKPSVEDSPVPRFDLLRLEDYASMSVQYSRGCPFNCEFCDVIVLFGRVPRVKSAARFLAELEALYALGYRGFVNVVDDNLIGHRKEIRRLLPRLERWNLAHDDPFVFSTQLTIDLALDRPLLEQLVRCRFRGGLIGLETPSLESLRETDKLQNTREPLVDSVRRLQEAGFLPSAGFIVGFDHDDATIFQRQLEFLRQAAVPFAMIGLLVALPGTRLFERLRGEGRLLDDDFSADQFVSTNVVTRLPRRELLSGYRRLLAQAYEPSEYFARTLTALGRLPRERRLAGRLRAVAWHGRRAAQNLRRPARRRRPGEALRAARGFLIELPRSYRRASMRFLGQVLRRFPDHLPRALTFVVLGAHFHRYAYEHVLPRLDAELARASSDVACGSQATAGRI
jgi:radical SAM superfamily enzyme YgiQ (UPF0313 family)